jgi:Flp pilus assembly protein TadD
MSLSNPNSRADVQNRLVSAASRNPEDARAEEALGSMALRQGHISEARSHFHKAIDRHSTDPTAYFYAAYYDRQEGVPADQTLPLLREALVLKPDYYDARLELALLGASNKDYALALDSLNKIGTPHPEHAYTIAYSIAYCYAQTDRLTEARKYANQAKQLAKTEADRAEVANLFTYIAEQAQYVSDKQ